ncbi:RagB/SusD family nutrient uptake outer membrane protein [Dyadobacter sp. CY351]|uniref:RagB/SusD family nutrient uptake outer membrane protein n=1 Tax=Dyadobacter sp. CY351 TaxID=2909337 RepID=UPI001F3C0347|nr:RagB/SusD family nutrient uptake outer membrane protein [Dyadobacter sp. CY351]MCF2517485.1 RagB/SusD family nutrient uptake outer membrane protein [Dyadobacter sp. CY351]
MKKILLILSISLLVITGCKEDFLTREPQDALTDDSYWTNEKNVRTFAWGFYPNYFPAYGSGFTFGRYFTGQTLNDDFAPLSPTQFIKNVPATSTTWTFTWVRKANLFLDRIQTVPMEQEAIAHWSGIARFFRAMEYHELVRTYGDVPFYDKALDEKDAAGLYKKRQPRTEVMDKVLEDFQFAAANVRADDGEKGLTVNKSVVLAFMSRVFLFEGTYLKYHNIDQARAKTYLEAAKWAANEVMQSGRYTISENYRSLFTSISLAGSKEMILYRKYETGQLTHSLNSYNNKEPQSGASKSAVESYLSKDGLPIAVSPLYLGDKNIKNVMTNRDPRFTSTFVDALRVSKYAPNASSSGYATWKFLNEETKELPEGSGSLNQTDGPVIRYGEVLLNYAEAAAELGAMVQADLDQSVNPLRARPGVALPPLQVLGGLPAVNGKVYDDPKRDKTVASLLWEIRRERRVELMMEGFRLNDLTRWKKMEYTDTKVNADINRGAWIKKADYPNTDAIIEGGAAEGYIIPASKPESQRLFESPKVYLTPIPLDQIKLYQDAGSELTQNPGWE